MCYVRKYQYKIEPKESYKVIRNCPGCGRKSLYYNTNQFRVNANGNKVDIWLVYQCETCKHTYNLGIYERVKPDDIEHDQYERFLNNDSMLSKKYGMDKTFFLRNRTTIDEKGMNYLLESESNIAGSGTDCVIFNPGDLIEVNNRYGLKIRTEKIVADVLNVSRMKAQKFVNCGIIQVDKKNQDGTIRIGVKGEILNESKNETNNTNNTK